MEQLRTGIFEDNEKERIGLYKMVMEADAETDIMVEYGESGEALLDSFYPEKFDLIFLDIYLSGMTGIEALSKIREKDDVVDAVIMTTSRDFTLESFRLKVVRYLEKPVKEEDIKEILLNAKMKKETKPHFLIKNQNSLLRIPFDMITMVEQMGRKLKLSLSLGKLVAGSGSLDGVECEFSPKYFCRCHKSYLVNLSYVHHIDRELSAFVMQDGAIVCISRRKFWEVKRTFENFLFACMEYYKNG